MKVLYLTGIPAPYRVDLFNELGKTIDLTVAFLAQYQGERNSTWQSSTPVNFQAVFLNKGALNGKRFDLSMVRYLKKHARSYDFIVIHGYAFAASILAIMWLVKNKIRYGLEADGAMLPASEHPLRAAIKRFCIGNAAFYLSSGEATTEYFKHYGADADRCYVYPFTSVSKQDLADSRQFSSEEKEKIREDLGIAEKRVILTVGRFSYQNGYGKGYDVLMKVAEKAAKDIGFYFVGDEPTEEFMQWKAQKDLQNVHFVGFREKQQLYAYYACADLFALLTRGDVWGLAVNEAMTFGLPIITTTKCLAGLELVENDINGYIVDVEDFAMVNRTILACIYDDEKLTAYGKNSREMIMDYTIECSSISHIQAFKAALR